jgi:hypothetical protein
MNRIRARGSRGRARPEAAHGTTPRCFLRAAAPTGPQAGRWLHPASSAAALQGSAHGHSRSVYCDWAECPSVMCWIYMAGHPAAHVSVSRCMIRAFGDQVKEQNVFRRPIGRVPSQVSL